MENNILRKRILTKTGFIFCLIVLITPVISSGFTFSTARNTYSFASSNASDKTSYLITGVPYISQETDFFCAYASSTMVLRYYGVNVSLHETLFNSGAGYSLVYSPPFLKRFPIGCIGSCKWNLDRSFLAGLYGLSYEEWRPADSLNARQRWDQYWLRVKENISQGRPVITNIDPVFLPSIRDAIRKELDIQEGLWTNIMDHLWKLVPDDIYHAIVIVGYNETNGTICFNDPLAALYNHSEEGTYKWMQLDSFRVAQRRLMLNRPYFAYSLELFKNSLDPIPINKTEIFARVLQRNIEKMKGNTSVYDKHVLNDWKCQYFGIKGLEQLYIDVGPGISHRVTTISFYEIASLIHLLSFEYKLRVLLEKIIPPTCNVTMCPNLVNKFREIATEKYTISQYLSTTKDQLNDSNLSSICQSNAQLLQYEAENWTKLANNFSVFLERGIFMTIPKGITIMKNMENITKDIISIEHQIIE